MGLKSTSLKIILALTITTCKNERGLTDLNERAKIIEFLEENIEEKLHDIGFGFDFLDMTPKAQATKEKKIK